MKFLGTQQQFLSFQMATTIRFTGLLMMSIIRIKRLIRSHVLVLLPTKSDKHLSAKAVRGKVSHHLDGFLCFIESITRNIVENASIISSHRHVKDPVLTSSLCAKEECTTLYEVTRARNIGWNNSFLKLEKVKYRICTLRLCLS